MMPNLKLAWQDRTCAVHLAFVLAHVATVCHQTCHQAQLESVTGQPHDLPGTVGRQ